MTMTNNEQGIERQLIEMIATDRIDMPISSMSGKLKRAKPKLAQAIAVSFDGSQYNGERVYARFEESNEMKARGMKDGIDKFCGNFPREGSVLRGYIEEQRMIREQHLYFGMQEGCKITSADYIGVMKNLGFSDATADRLYPELMDISRKLSKKRDEERSILIG